MITVLSTEIFDNWIDALKDVRAKTKIQARIRRLKNGNSGDIEPVGEGFSEMRIHEGKGYRVYLKKHGKVIVVLLFCCVVEIKVHNKKIYSELKPFTKKSRGSYEN